jgi:hypothetical protein
VEVALPQGRDRDLRVSVDSGIVLEGTVALPGRLSIGNRSGAGVEIRFDRSGVTEIGPGTQEGATFSCEERVDREIALGPSPSLRLLLRQTMLEFYLQDVMIQCYTMDSGADGRISCQGAYDLSLWRWSA